MVNHIEVNCSEFKDYNLEQRKVLLRLQMEQYIKTVSLIVKHSDETNFQIDFTISEDIGEELEGIIELDYKSNIEKEFFIKYEELMEHFNINTNKISFKISKRVLI